MTNNKLYYGDNLHVLREFVATDSVDLIYLDPPFNSKQDYNILFKTPVGAPASAQIEAFGDTWHWGEEAERAYEEVLRCGNTKLADMISAFRSFLRENDMMAYLAMMAIRLVELRRVLKSTGSIYLHCDPTASHYIKILMDGVFGQSSFRNEIIWKRTSAHSSARRFGPVHDVILFYTASDNYIWNKIVQSYDQKYLETKYRQEDKRGKYRLSDLTAAGVRSGDSGKPWRGFDPTPLGRHWGVPSALVESVDPTASGLSTQRKLDCLDEAGFIYWTPGRGQKPGFPQLKRHLTGGQPAQDVIDDIAPINSMAKERLGYPTQKPVPLLERLISASSNPGDLVLDPFCGCGTAVDAAQGLGRLWTGIDITYLAIGLIERRLMARHRGIKPIVLGAPRDIESAAHLAATNPYQFQWWAVSLVDAQPFGGRRKGADGGIDGVIYFRSAANRTERAIVSVKGGEHAGLGAVKELRATIEGERAPIGVLITLREPNQNMEKEAARAGFTDREHGAVPRLQLLSVRDLLHGKRPRIPLIDVGAAYRQATRHVRPVEQEELAI